MMLHFGSHVYDRRAFAAQKCKHQRYMQSDELIGQEAEAILSLCPYPATIADNAALGDAKRQANADCVWRMDFGDDARLATARFGYEEAAHRKASIRRCSFSHDDADFMPEARH